MVVVFAHCQYEVVLLAKPHRVADFEVAVRPLVGEVGNDDL
jgi:hypothetical protein